MSTTADRPTTAELWTTENGQKLHLLACPYLAEKDDVRRATSVEVAARVPCVHCRKELDGEGRTYYRSLDDALRAFGLAPGNQSAVRAAVAETDHDEVWIVHSAGYIALGLRGRTALGINKSFLRHRDGRVVTFAGYRPGSGGGAPVPEQRRGELCPVHFLEMPLDGICQDCA